MHRDLSLHWNVAVWEALGEPTNLCTSLCMFDGARISVRIYNTPSDHNHLFGEQPTRNARWNGSDSIFFGCIVNFIWWNLSWSAYFWFDFPSIYAEMYFGGNEPMHTASRWYTKWSKWTKKNCEQFNFSGSHESVISLFFRSWIFQWNFEVAIFSYFCCCLWIVCGKKWHHVEF